MFLKKRAQTTMELTAALVLVMILLVGAVKMFVWLNGRMIKRAEDYDATRVAAGSVPQAAVTLNLNRQDNVDTDNLKFVNENVVSQSAYRKLDVFEKQE